ncbi:DUF6894 family protein [Sphingomonas quercus]|uniref:DUF6894 domain-containing protein n=1 Tax=Sphingomonas quercus TaxID=2842451 RepID=A0ABS6BJA9_9SPHN|nr:hypothetical protein [Sphingomonas quercus]MBU3077526.1 hypothetical protein [Sphingomonas quercus]
MPHYYFDLHNGTGLTRDEEGLDLVDEAAARAVSLETIRSILSDEARSGSLDLVGRIDVRGAAGETVMSISFEDAVQVRQPAGAAHD